MIKVFLVDDQNLVRQGVQALLALAEDIEVVGEAADGREAVEKIPQTDVDVVLLDMRMPGLSGLDVLQQLAEKDQLPPTIILTTFDEDEMVLAGVRHGAKGYLLKDVPLQELVDGIKQVAAGKTIVRPQVTEKILENVSHLKNDFTSFSEPESLTARETEILRLMAGGHSNKEIANSLFVAEGTVKNHVSNILSKLGVRDRTRAVLKALELGLI
jgi:DNA-binding NarL/FixJ family response regulator